MPKTNRTLAYAGESIPFHLSYSKRKTVEIAVHPDGSVVVKAPLGTNETLVENFVYKRVRWIRRQLRHFAQFGPPTPKRQFVGGESHLYLGKQYRLKIRPSATDQVLLKRGFFHIQAVDDTPEHIAMLLEAWYRSKAEVYFAQLFEECWQIFRGPNKTRGAIFATRASRPCHSRVGGNPVLLGPLKKEEVEKPVLKIRKMKTLWGSFSVKSGITLNLELIKAPRACIEYVVIHELCHLLHLNHGPEFYNLLEQFIPDWIKRKRRLETVLS